MSKENKCPEFIKEGDGYADITLASSIKVDGATVSTIRMREPSVRDLENSQDSREKPATAEIQMFANLCEMTPDQIRDLTARNYFRLQASFARFTR